MFLSIDFFHHNQALAFVEKNKELVKNNSILRQDLTEKDNQIQLLQEKLYLFKASVKGEIVNLIKTRLTSLLQDQEKQVQDIVHILTSLSGNDENSLLQLTSPGRISDKSRNSSRSNLEVNRNHVPSSSSSLLVSSGQRSPSNISFAMTTEDQEWHRRCALERIEMKRQENGSPLPTIPESSFLPETIEVSGYKTREPSIREEVDTIVAPTDLIMDSLRESNFGPIECSTAKKYSLTEVQNETVVPLVLPKKSYRREPTRLSIHNSIIEFRSPELPDEENENETMEAESIEDYVDSDEDTKMHDSASLSSLSDITGIRQSFISSFVNNESFKRKIALDDSESSIHRTSINEETFKDKKIASHAYGLLTDSSSEDELKEFLQSQPKPAVVIEETEEDTEVEENLKPVENIEKPKSRKTSSRTSKKKEIEAVSEQETQEKKSGKRKKPLEANSSSKDKKLQKTSEVEIVISSSSPIVKVNKGQKKQSSIGSASMRRGSSLFGYSGDDNTLNISESGRPSRRAKEGVVYKEPPQRAKLRRGDPNWCKI